MGFVKPRNDKASAALETAARREEEQSEKLEARNEARIRNLRARRSGRRALLAFAIGAETPGGELGAGTTLG